MGGSAKHQHDQERSDHHPDQRVRLTPLQIVVGCTLSPGRYEPHELSAPPPEKATDLERLMKILCVEDKRDNVYGGVHGFLMAAQGRNLPDPWYQAAALAHGIVGPATNQSRIGGKAENIYSM